MGENRRPVLAADIRSLPTWRGRIVDLPEDIQQLLVRDAIRVEGNLDHFDMAGFVAADVLVGRVFLRSAQIARSGIEDAVHMTERRLDAPEAAGSKCRFFHLRLPSGVAHCPISGLAQARLHRTAPDGTLR